jgi:hypothetical protein
MQKKKPPLNDEIEIDIFHNYWLSAKFLKHTNFIPSHKLPICIAKGISPFDNLTGELITRSKTKILPPHLPLTFDINIQPLKPHSSQIFDNFKDFSSPEENNCSSVKNDRSSDEYVQTLPLFTSEENENPLSIPTSEEKENPLFIPTSREKGNLSIFPSFQSNNISSKSQSNYKKTLYFLVFVSIAFVLLYYIITS